MPYNVHTICLFQENNIGTSLTINNSLTTNKIRLRHTLTHLCQVSVCRGGLPCIFVYRSLAEKHKNTKLFQMKMTRHKNCHATIMPLGDEDMQLDITDCIVPITTSGNAHLLVRLVSVFQRGRSVLQRVFSTQVSASNKRKCQQGAGHLTPWHCRTDKSRRVQLRVEALYTCKTAFS